MRKVLAMVVCVAGLLCASGLIALEAGPSRSATPAAMATGACIAGDDTPVADLLQAQVRRWDAAKAAFDESTGARRGDDLATLERLSREAKDRRYPDCGKSAQQLLVDTMDTYINGYHAAQLRESETAVANIFAYADATRAEFGGVVAALRPVPAASTDGNAP